ncbi:MAG TPA: hypothetical protein VKM54_13365 [Myxococcota bacterium]|nr:hypothetical protein [Myxococcota bacterium]
MRDELPAHAPLGADQTDCLQEERAFLRKTALLADPDGKALPLYAETARRERPETRVWRQEFNATGTQGKKEAELGGATDAV